MEQQNTKNAKQTGSFAKFVDSATYFSSQKKFKEVGYGIFPVLFIINLIVNVFIEGNHLELGGFKAINFYYVFSFTSFAFLIGISIQNIKAKTGKGWYMLGLSLFYPVVLFTFSFILAV